MLNKVMEEFNRRLESQNEQVNVGFLLIFNLIHMVFA